MSERSGQTAKGKEGKTKYASLNLFDTYKGKSLETQKPVVPPRHGLQSLGKVASARRMPPPANLPSLKAENKGNDPNVSLVPKDGTGWASKQEPADPKSTDALSAPQPESQQPVASQIAAPTRPRTPPISEALAPPSTQAVGARSWAQASVTHGTQGDGGKGSNLPSPFSREEFPTLQSAGDQDKAGREPATADQWYGPGPSLRPQNVTSWRDGGGRALAPTLPGEGAAEGGTGGALVMDGAAGVPHPNPQIQGPPRNPPAGSPALPLPQPPVGPGFPPYRGIMPPFMYPPYLPFPGPYGPQGPYRYPPPGEGPPPRFSRGQGPDSRAQGGPRDSGEVVKRPSILKQDDLKELDELDHDGDDGWAGANEEIDYSAKLKFSDDEADEEGDEDKKESKNDSREQQRSQDAPTANSHSRASDSGGESRHTPPSNVDGAPQPPSSKPGWAEEGSGGWGNQGAPSSYQDRPHGQGSLLGLGKPVAAAAQLQPGPAGPAASSQPGLLVHSSQGDDEDETWRQRRQQSSSEISAAVERARRRREEEERRMEEERRAACAEKLKRLDEKQQQGSGPAAAAASSSKTPSLDGNSTAAAAGSPSPSVSASSPNISQPASPCVDPEEPPVLAAQSGSGSGASDRRRASSNSSYDSTADVQQCPQPAVSQPQQPTLDVPPSVESKEESAASPHVRAGSGGERGVEPVKMESSGVGVGRQAGGPPGQGYSKYQKSLPPRFQRQQQEQLLKQQQQWQQQQQHSQASQSQLSPQPQAPQGPSPGSSPQPGPGPKQGGPLYQPGSMVRPPPLPMNFDPRWIMMPYMDPRVMQGRPPPMEYYSAGMHPSGLIGRERSDSGGSGSEPFDRQQQQQLPGHPHRGTPPIDPKLAWGPEVFPGGADNRGLTSPLRQKQALEEEDVGKGPRSDTPPHRLRDGGLGPVQQPSSSSGTSSQTPPPPVGVQVGSQGGTHHPHHYIGGRGNYSNFPDQGARMPPHPQQRQGERGNLPHGFTHPDDGSSRGPQQVQIWGAPHSRNGRADLPTVEGSAHLPHHHSHHHQQPQFSLNPHKAENSRDRAGEAPAKKTDSSPPLHQPSLSSSCSSSSSSAREDGKATQHHPPPLREGESGVGERGSNSHMKPDKQGPTFLAHSNQNPLQHGGHNQTQQHPHSKPNQRGGREHKTETQWGPRPGSNSMGGGSSHGRRGNNAGRGEDPSSTPSDHKPSNQAGGSNPNKRAGPIKKPLLKEIKREGVEADGGDKQGKEKEQDGGQPASMKQDASSMPQNASTATKEEQNHTAKTRSGGKERASGGGGGSGRGSKDVDSLSSGFPSRRDRDRSFERGGVPVKGGRPSRGRGGEFYRGGRGYRGTYTASAGPAGGGRGRMGARSGRDYRSSTGGGHHQEAKGDGSGVRHGQDRSQHNPARARNRSETRSEGSEYEEIPKRRRERGSETGSESGGSDLGHSDKEEHPKPNSKNCSENAGATGNVSSVAPRVSQARVFTPRGVPSRRGRGGGSGGGNMYRGSGTVGGPVGGHRVGPGSGSYAGSSKSAASGRKQQGPPQTSGPKDLGRGGGTGEKKDKVVDGGQNQGPNPPPPSLPATTPPAVASAENGGVIIQQAATNPAPNSGGPNAPPDPANRCHPPGGFDRPPRRRRHGRSQHQQDKPPRFRRLKERENAARINGSVGIIGGGRPSSPSLNSVQDSNGAPAAATVAGNAPNHSSTLSNNNSGGQPNNTNSHHHHHYNQSNAAPAHAQHHHNHGAKSPDFTNQNSDQANEEWETASESSDFTEFRDRDAGGGKSYVSHHHHHPGRGGGGGLVDRDMAGKEPSANKRSFSSQRPGMERQNRRVNTGGGGGRGPRGPPGGGGSGAPSNGGGNRGEKRGNWPSPKNRK